MKSIRRYLISVCSLSLAAGLGACMSDDGDDTQDAVSDDLPAISHPDDDYAGSQIAIHETTSDVPEIDNFAVTQTPGMDVSSFQGNVNWSSAKSHGAHFAYVKATEGVTYRNPYFAQQYVGSYNAGIIRGSYHFALPDRSSGATQADYFIAHGGGWSRDGKTFPGALDIEYNPYGQVCYGKSHAAMVTWIHDFANRYKQRTGRDVVIYTTTNWWTMCTGNNGGFSNNPLWIANYNGTPYPLPHGWSFYTIWQNADHGVFPGDHDLFNGDASRVKAFAL